MTISQITNISELKKQIESGTRIVADFYATWCGPCRAVGPKVDELSDKYSSISFFKINIDENREAAEYFSITTIPTFIFFVGGKEVSRHSTSDPNLLEEAIKKLC